MFMIDSDRLRSSQIVYDDNDDDDDNVSVIMIFRDFLFLRNRETNKNTFFLWLRYAKLLSIFLIHFFRFLKIVIAVSLSGPAAGRKKTGEKRNYFLNWFCLAFPSTIVIFRCNILHAVVVEGEKYPL